MKKLIAALLVLVTLLSLCACGQDEGTPTDPAYNNGTNGNNNIQPTVKPTQPAPTEPQKSDAVKKVEDKISKLGEITLDSLDALESVQEAVDKLSKEEKAMVENMGDLEDAWATYNTLVNKAAAAEIDEAIANMGDATYKNRQAVIDAMRLYSNASADVQKHVKKAEDLKAAANTVAKEMMKKMEVEEDFVRNLNFYYHSQFPRGDEYWYADQRCFSLPYLGKQGNNVWLRWICNYTDDDWVFFKKITFAVDDARYYRTFSYYDVTRDNGGGDVWEYVDMQVGASELEILQAIANSEKTVIRFEGDDYYRDFTVKEKDKEAIQFTLDLYLLLGGK